MSQVADQGLLGDAGEFGWVLVCNCIDFSRCFSCFFSNRVEVLYGHGRSNYWCRLDTGWFDMAEWSISHVMVLDCKVWLSGRLIGSLIGRGGGERVRYVGGGL